MSVYRSFVASPVKLFFACLIIAALYYFSAKLGLLLAVVQKNATPVWPPSGIAIAVMLVFGYRIWPGIFLGAMVVNLSTELSFITATTIASGNTLEAVTAVYLIWRFIGSSYPLSRTTDFFRFVILACVLATIVSATIGVTTLALSNELPWAAYWLVWGIWWAGDAVGALVVAPLLLGFFYINRYAFAALGRSLELIVVVFLISLISFMIFSDVITSQFTRLLIGLGLIPVLIWSSFRFDIRLTTVNIFILSVISVLGTARGFGPLVQESVNESVILLQGFIAVTALTIVSLTIVVGEYNRAESLFRHARDKSAPEQGLTAIDDPVLSREVWRSLAENSPDHIMLLDTEGKIVFINHTIEGLTAEDVIGNSVYKYLAPEQVPTIRTCYERVLKTGETDQFDAVYPGISGPLYFENRVAAVKHQGKIVGLTVSSRDMTARKKTELVKARLLEILDATSDFVAMADKEGRALYLNSAGRHMMGFSQDIDINKTCIADYHSELQAEKVFTEAIPAADKHGIWSGELKFLNRNGEEIPTTTVVLAHKSETGAVEYYSAIARDISEQLNAEKEILESQAMLELVVNNIPVRIFWKDTDSNYLGCNSLFAQDAGAETQESLIGKNDFDFWPEQAELYRSDDKQVMESGIPKKNYEEPQKTPAGDTLWLETTKIPLRNVDNDVVGVLGAYYDITDRKRVENTISTLAKQSSSLQSSDAFFKECLSNLGRFYNTDFIFIGLLSEDKSLVNTYLVWRKGKFVDNFNYELAGTPCEDVINSSSNLVSEKVAYKYPEDKMLADMKLESYFGSALTLPNGKVFGLVVATDTKPLYLEPWAKPILDIYASRIAIEMERKRIEDELQGMANTMSYQASHDPLTDLINRREFEERLQGALKVSRLEGHQHALCYLDLDQFKVVNDTCGHIAGDELLKLLAEQLHSAIRESDTLARLGGDEFGVLLQDCPIDKAVGIAENLLNVVKGFRFAWEDKLFEIGVSIGLVQIDENTISINHALSAADSSCYLAKELGRNRIHVYQEDDAEITKRHGEMQLISEITQALEQERFVLYAQSIIPLNTSEAANKRHFEVLIRMQDHNKKIILPGAFIGAAERYNLMPSLDKWVIETSFKYLHGLKKSDSNNHDLCAINLSGTTLSEDKFLDYMHGLLDKYDIPPSMICFEITETAAITNITKAMNFISRFKDIGFQFALDDFGAGLSSYSYLKNLPVDYVKIDGGFVSGINRDPLNRSIVESITQVGHTMGIQIIAEWVDSDEVLNTLTDIGVDYAQGFSINKPAPLG